MTEYPGNPKFIYAMHVYTLYVQLNAYLCHPLGRIKTPVAPGGMMWEMNDMLTKSTWATKRL